MTSLNKRAKIIFTVAGALAVLALSLLSNWRYAGRLETIFLDVGQGDAILIKTGAGQNILIDGGPDNSVVYGLGRYLTFYERTLDLVILTHPDSDHLIGLVEVLKRYKVKKILLTDRVGNTAEYIAWKKAVAEEGAEVILARAGQKFDFDWQTKMTVLHPFEEISLNEMPTNDTSVVVRLDHGKNSWLLTGDLPIEEEEKIVDKEKEFLDVEVLKVGHHGSKYSSGDNFLKAVTPKLAIIMVGEKNRFGHPAFAALERLRKIGAEIERTDQLGDICLVSDGERLGVCEE